MTTEQQQNLFDYMANEHDVILLEGDMDQIERILNRKYPNTKEFNRFDMIKFAEYCSKQYPDRMKARDFYNSLTYDERKSIAEISPHWGKDNYYIFDFAETYSNNQTKEQTKALRELSDAVHNHIAIYPDGGELDTSVKQAKQILKQ